MGGLWRRRQRSFGAQGHCDAKFCAGCCFQWVAIQSTRKRRHFTAFSRRSHAFLLGFEESL
eukprot:5574123-Prorocentrum_lima.AAC.1